MARDDEIEDGDIELEDDSLLDEHPVQDSPLISGLRVEGLFGRYNYDLSFPNNAMSDRLVMLYGDNGSGKTTILKILWSALSPEGNRGHRTALEKYPFRLFGVSFSDGSYIEVLKNRDVSGPFSITVTHSDGAIQKSEWASSSPNPFKGWNLEELESQLGFLTDEMRAEVNLEINQLTFLKHLTKLSAQPYYLADNRYFYSDDVAQRRLTPRQIRETELEATVSNQPDTPGLLERELELSVRRADEIIRRMTLGGTNSGSADANSVYLDVVRRLGGRLELPSDESVESMRLNLASRLTSLGERNLEFERLGLAPKFDSDEFVQILNTLHDVSVSTVDQVLSPYLKSLEARMDALLDAQQLIRTFLDQVNSFLTDKELGYQPRTGLRLELKDQKRLPFARLSSGEIQLTMLLCNALLARQKSHLFLVDEPELSLNVKWQRKIVPALLACTAGSKVQFIIATHSIELLTAKADNVVSLEAV